MSDQGGRYTAWDGNTYSGSPPAGWYFARDGRWWSPGSGPGPATPPPAQAYAPLPLPPRADPRPTWKKKRFIIPMAGFLTIGTIAAVSEPPEDERPVALAADGSASLTSTSTIPSSSTTSTTVASTTTTAAPPATETTAAAPEPLSDDDLLRINAIALKLTMEPELPILGSLSNEEIAGLAEGPCAIAAVSADRQAWMDNIALSWDATFDAWAKAFFDDEFELYAKFTGASTAAFCPEDYDRLTDDGG